MLEPVTLRDVADEDIPILFEQQADAGAARMAAFPSRDREAHAAHWEKIRANASMCARTILAGDRVAGNIGSFDRDGLRLVGYWLGREYWGRGIASRALALFLAVERTRPLHAYVAKHNAGSIRVLEKNGFVKVRDDTPHPAAAGDAAPVEEWLMRLDGGPAAPPGASPAGA